MVTIFPFIKAVLVKLSSISVTPLASEPLLALQVHHPHIIKQRRAALDGKGMVAFQKDGQGLAGSPDCQLGMHPSLFLCLVPGMPRHSCCLPALSAGEV